MWRKPFYCSWEAIEGRLILFQFPSVATKRMEQRSHYLANVFVNTEVGGIAALDAHNDSMAVAGNTLAGVENTKTVVDSYGRLLPLLITTVKGSLMDDDDKKTRLS